MQQQFKKVSIPKLFVLDILNLVLRFTRVSQTTCIIIFLQFQANIKFSFANFGHNIYIKSHKICGAKTFMVSNLYFIRMVVCELHENYVKTVPPFLFLGT